LKRVEGRLELFNLFFEIFALSYRIFLGRFSSHGQDTIILLYSRRHADKIENVQNNYSRGAQSATASDRCVRGSIIFLFFVFFSH